MSADVVDQMTPRAASLARAVRHRNSVAVKRLLSDMDMQEMWAMAIALARMASDVSVAAATEASYHRRIAEVAATVATRYRLHPEDLIGRSRHASTCEARQVAWRAAWLLGETQTAIAEQYGRDHTTVSHGIARAGEMAKARRIALQVATAHGYQRDADEDY